MSLTTFILGFLLIFSFVFVLLRERIIRGRVKRQVCKLGGEVTNMTKHIPSTTSIQSRDSVLDNYSSSQSNKAYYVVEYKDADGNQYVRMCRTSLLGSFFWMN